MCIHGLLKKKVILLIFWMTIIAAKDVIERLSNTQVHGGIYQANHKTQSACETACSTAENCWSVDFNKGARSCWFHHQDTGCSDTKSALNVEHTKFVGCYPEKHIIGGTRTPQRDLSSCVGNCKADGTCVAVDFDNSDKSCWSHTRTSACSELLSKSTVDHFKIAICQSSMVSANSQSSNDNPAPVGTQNDQPSPIFVKETHNRMHAHGGQLYGRLLGWEDCVRVCADSSTCKAVDHVRGANTCWLHGLSSSCSKLSVCGRCTHYKLYLCARNQVVAGTCGRPAISPISGRVIGGRSSIPHSWPWMLTLRHQNHNVVRCGATFLGDKWVLTTAHCVDEDPVGSHWEISCRAHDLRRYEPTRQYRRAARVIIHPNFDPTTFDYDAALIELERPFSSSPEVSPVCLPSNGQYVLPGTLCAVTGWGKPSRDRRVMNQAFVPIVELSVCRRREWLGGQFHITDRMICAGYENGNVDSCQGDSGGPLVCYEGNKWIQIGITSFGRGCGLSRKPGVYMNVSTVVSWISSITGITLNS